MPTSVNNVAAALKSSRPMIYSGLRDMQWKKDVKAVADCLRFPVKEDARREQFLNDCGYYEE
jgi:hypothetical protein